VDKKRHHTFSGIFIFTKNSILAKMWLKNAVVYSLIKAIEIISIILLIRNQKLKGWS